VAGGTDRRVAAPALAAAVVTSGGGVAVNLATEWKTNPWAWAAVGVITVLAAVVAQWLALRQSPGLPIGGGPSVTDAVIGRDNIQIGRARDVTIDRDP
jgi:hypothetical protein